MHEIEGGQQDNKHIDNTTVTKHSTYRYRQRTERNRGMKALLNVSFLCMNHRLYVHVWNISLLAREAAVSTIIKQLVTNLWYITTTCKGSCQFQSGQRLLHLAPLIPDSHCTYCHTRQQKCYARRHLKPGNKDCIKSQTKQTRNVIYLDGKEMRKDWSASEELF
jgi:hypothetical protein